MFIVDSRVLLQHRTIRDPERNRPFSSHINYINFQHIKTKINLNCLRRSCSYLAVNILPLDYKNNSFNIVKGKAVPLEAWTGPEGSGKLRFTDFVTTAQDGGKVVGLTYRPPLS